MQVCARSIGEERVNEKGKVKNENHNENGEEEKENERVEETKKLTKTEKHERTIETPKHHHIPTTSPSPDTARPPPQTHHNHTHRLSSVKMHHCVRYVRKVACKCVPDQEERGKEIISEGEVGIKRISERNIG